MITAPSQRPDPDVLRRAAALIRERGLARETYVDRQGCVCAAAAIVLAHGAILCYPTGALPEEIKTLPEITALAKWIDAQPYDLSWLKDSDAISLVIEWVDGSPITEAHCDDPQCDNAEPRPVTADEVIAGLEEVAGLVERGELVPA